MADVFREAVKRGQVRSYTDRQLDLELRFLQEVNGCAKAPTAGPVTTDDVAVTTMVVVNELLGGHVGTHQQLSAVSLRGLPSLNPADNAVFSAFSSGRTWSAPGHNNPARPNRFAVR